MWIKYDDSEGTSVIINTDNISMIEYNNNFIMINMTSGQSYTARFGTSVYQKLFKFITLLDKQQSYIALLLFFVGYRMIHSIKNKAEEQKEKFLADHNDQDISSVLAGRRWNNEHDAKLYDDMISKYLYDLALMF